jgi:hypothetical protein
VVDLGTHANPDASLAANCDHFSVADQSDFHSYQMFGYTVVSGGFHRPFPSENKK